MYLSVLICTLLAVFVSSSPYAVKQSFQINATEGINVFVFQTNLKNTSLLSVESTTDLIFCFQEQYEMTNKDSPLINVSVINRNPVYWGQGVCSFTVQTTGNQIVEVNLKMTPYSVGVFFKNTSLTNATTEVNMTLGTADDSCPSTQIFVSGACVDFVDLKENFAKIDAPAQKTSAYRFTLPTAQITGKITFSCHDNTTDGLTYWFQRDNTPLIDGTTGKCAPGAAEVVVEFPRNGLTGYYLIIENTKEAVQSLNIEAKVCPDNKGGANCDINILNSLTTPQLIMNMRDVYYFRVNATTRVWVNARRVNGTKIFVNNPLIFASRNQLPQSTNADIGGTTEYYSDLVHTIKFNVTDNQTWYIGIQNSDAILNGTTVGVWFDSTCAPDCQDHGTCADDGPQTGFCDCIDGFMGVDCQLPNGFGPQFIVLIIIAVLVALTAVIGFGAWAYMRRKRNQYDIVS